MEYQKSDKNKNRLSYIAVGISLFSATAAVFSCFFAYQFLSTAKSHFILLNQGYLRIKPELHITIPKNDARILAKVSQITDDLLIDGLNPKLVLKNVGNIPLKYDVKEFSVFLNDRKYGKIDEKGRTTGVLYPDQTVTFELATVHFDHLQPEKVINFASLRKIRITSKIKVAYTDIGSEDRIKYCDRTLDWEVHKNFIKYVWSEINDRI